MDQYLREDLIPRLKKAIGALEQVQEQTYTLREKVRLDGKLEGVKLALSYAEEGLRT